MDVGILPNYLNLVSLLSFLVHYFDLYFRIMKSFNGCLYCIGFLTKPFCLSKLLCAALKEAQILFGSIAYHLFYLPYLYCLFYLDYVIRKFNSFHLCLSKTRGVHGSGRGGY
jgi:hypothetical protein